MNQNLLNQISQPVNHVAKAYEARSGQLQQQRDAKQAAELEVQKQRDNDMLKVFEFAGDGRVDEAKIYAQRKGIEIPNEIMGNADMAKGLSFAGKFYGDDPAGAQQFSLAWMQTRNEPDTATRILKASQIAGIPIDPEDRKFRNEVNLEQFKYGLKSQDARRDLFKDATTESLGSFYPDPNAGATAVKQYDQFFGDPTASPNLTSSPISVRNNNPGNLREVGQTTGLRRFQTPEAGVDAMRSDLMAKISGRSSAMASRYGAGYVPTLSNVITTWAPPEENNTAAYINFVAQRSGLNPNQPLMPQDIDRIIPAMIAMEGGQEATNYYGDVGAGQPQQQISYQEGQTATNPQTGEKVIFQGGQWNPVSQENNSVVSTPKSEISFVNQQNQEYNPNSGYFSSVPSDTRIDRISKNLANYTNIPAHVSNIIKAGGSGLRSSANYVGNTAVNAVEGVGDYLNESPYVMVTAPNGKSGYIPREQLQQALSQGYLLGADNGTPSVPMS